MPRKKPPVAAPKTATASRDEELDQLLRNLRLFRVLAEVDAELDRATKGQVSYRELLVRLLRAEWHAQTERRCEARIERARLPEPWALETFPYALQPGVNRTSIEQLATLDFIAQGTNLVFIGEPGTGKTGIASSLLLKALQQGYRGRFVKAQELFDELYTTLADRSSTRLLRKLARLDLLLIDEMGYLNLRPEQTNLFFQLMELRYTEKRATIVTTNLNYDQWQAFLGNREATKALLDRLRQRCFTLRIDGPSIRAQTRQHSD